MIDPLKDDISKVELLDHMGDDLMVANAARVSYDKKSLEFSYSDAKLLHYLAVHNHWTPFSQPQLQFRIKMPIFVAREWYRHNVGLTRNEVSRRYVNSEPEFYFPEVLRNKPEAGQSKQGSSGIHSSSNIWCALMFQEMKRSVASYNLMIADGVAAEQARIVLPLGTYTEFIETGSLAAYARICRLRISPDAMQECRVFAEAVSELISSLFPVSWGELTK